MIKGWVKQGVCELYFYDESGFSLNSNIPYRWSPIGEPLKIPANRFSKRINVLGFLNTQTKDLLMTSPSKSQKLQSVYWIMHPYTPVKNLKKKLMNGKNLDYIYFIFLHIHLNLILLKCFRLF